MLGQERRDSILMENLHSGAESDQASSSVLRRTS